MLGSCANSLRNSNFFTSLLGHQNARPAVYESVGQEFESLRARHSTKSMTSSSGISGRH